MRERERGRRRKSRQDVTRLDISRRDGHDKNAIVTTGDICLFSVSQHGSRQDGRQKDKTQTEREEKTTVSQHRSRQDGRQKRQDECRKGGKDHYDDKVIRQGRDKINRRKESKQMQGQTRVMGKKRDHGADRERRHKETEEGKRIKKGEKKTRHKETGKARQKGDQGRQARHHNKAGKARRNTKTRPGRRERR